MEFTNLGRTGARVSVIGLGTGGSSRLGIAEGGSTYDALKLVRHALDKGINFIDLGGAIYGTDEIVGSAIRRCRSEVFISTKAPLGPYVGLLEHNRTSARASVRIGEIASFVTSGRVVEKRLDATLRRLKTDYIDLFSLHSVTLGQYAAAVERIFPALTRLRDKGKVRWIGISEAFRRDPSHKMTARAVSDGSFDALMIGFNILNPSGASISAQAGKRGQAIIAMQAVQPFRDEPQLDRSMRQLAGWPKPSTFQKDVPTLAKLLKSHGIDSLPEAALRFCRHELPADVVLVGTGDVLHLDANVAACLAPALPRPLLEELRKRVRPLDRISAHFSESA